MIIKPISSITGAVITGAAIGFGILNYIGILGFVLVIVGVFVLTSKKLEGVVSKKERQEARNVANYEKLKKGLKFIESHGAPPEDKRAWITMYHGHAKGAERDFSKLDSKLAPDGFYFAPNMSDVIGYFEREGLDRKDIKIIPVKISKRAYGPKDKTGIIKEAPNYDENYFKIPADRYKQANSLIRRGLIKLGRK